MTTLIDELIVRLSLDPSNFDEGQRKATQQLRQLETNAGRGVRAVGTQVNSTAKQISDFIGMINRPVDLLKRGLESIVEPSRRAHRGLQTVQDQGRRTGEEVEEGAGAGAVGLRGMAGAALIAVAAVIALSKAFEQLKKATTETFAAGVRAAAAGLPVERATAISQALFQHGLVPEEETQNFLATINQAQQRARRGDASQLTALAPELAKLGVTADITNAPSDEILKQIAVGLSKLTESQAIAAGQGLGISPQMALALREAGPNLERLIQAASSTAIKPQDVQAAKEFNEALARMATQWGALGRTLFTNVSPALIKIIDAFTFLAKVLRTVLATVTGHFGEIPGIWRGEGENAAGGAPRNNPGNIRAPGGGFREFSSYEEGVQAIQQNLTAYQDQHGLNTIRGIISRWAPPNENPTDQLIQNAAQRTGYGPDQPIDLHDPAVLDKVTNAIIVQEQGPARARSLAQQSSGAEAGPRTPPQPSPGASVGPDQKTIHIPDPLDWIFGRAAPTSPQPTQAPAAGSVTPQLTAPQAQTMGMLNSIQAGPQVANNQVSNDNSVSHTWGDIIVNTNTSNPQGTASAITDSLQRNLNTAQLNTGLA